MKTFRTSEGKVLDWNNWKLVKARKKVANDYRQIAHAIHDGDSYAEHITQEMKDGFLAERLEAADRVEHGTEQMTFALWQRLNAEITGECVPLFARQP